MYLTQLYLPKLQTGNHVRLQDIDIELGEVCTAITKYAMSNKNSNLDIEAVAEKHEMTPIASTKTPADNPVNIEPVSATPRANKTKAE